MNGDLGNPLAAAFEALRAGRAAEGLALAEAAVAQAPADPRAHALVARAALALGRRDAARRAIDRALALDPGSIPALVEAAALARAEGDAAALLARLTALIARAPEHVPFRIDHARAAAAHGDTGAARASLEAAIAAAPALPEPRILLAQLLLATGEPAAARAAADAALALVPDAEQALALAVEARLRIGEAAEAARLAEAFVARHPRSRPALIAWNRALQAARAPVAACLDVTGRIAAFDVSPVDWVLYAIGLAGAGRPAEADAAIDRALRRDPDYLPARWMRLTTPSPLVHPDADAEARFAAAVETGLDAILEADLARLDPADAELALIAAPRFNRHYLGGDLRGWQERSGRLLTALAARALPPPRPMRPRGHARPRVGICSAFLRRHTITKLFGALVEALDPAEFDLALLAPTDDVDETTRRLGAHARWVETGERPLAEWSAAIDRLDLDVLVFLDVGMSSLVEALAARRHARVQAMLWGHPVTSGFATMDWFLTADAMEREGGEQDYSERVLRLPGLGTCYEPPTLAPDVVPELAALPADAVVCAIPQMAQKLRPGHDRLLVALAEAVPNLVYAFTPHAVAEIGAQFRDRIGHRFVAAGLDPSARIVLCRALDFPSFLGLAARADFALDPIGWSGGNTSLELFWHDVPILTLPGMAMRSRHTLAMLERLELPALVACDEADYLARAIRLATDAEWRRTLRAAIAERKSRLYRDRRVVEAFVEFLRRAARGDADRPSPT
jgi:predicted O-linked N-acetylglucosamine transferase (SPINDLY family)